MEINWFTFFAQIVNFFVLVALLQYFVFRPVSAAMDRRERKIAARFQEAEQKRKEAENEAAQASRERLDLQHERENLLAQGRSEAERRKRELIEHAKSEVEQTKANWQRALKHEQESFLRQLRQQIGQQFCQVARKAFKDLADTTLEEQMTRIFTLRLHNLHPEAKKQMAAVLQEETGDIVVRSAFELGREARTEVESAVFEFAPPSCSIRYETSPKLICGLELKVNGQVVEWHLDSYLDTLEETFANRIAQQSPRS